MIRGHLYNKETWAPGPWQNEVDFQYWVDELTSYACAVKRNIFGAWVGYVGIDYQHSLFLSLIDCKEFEFIDTHGGPPTFVDWLPDIAIQFSPPQRLWWIGFDCIKEGDFCPWVDAPRETKTGKPRRRKKDEPTPEQYRDFQYATECVETLAAQLSTFDPRFF